MRFIIASSSPRRQQLISELGISFDVIKPDVDEQQHPDESPLAYVKRLSAAKASAAAAHVQDQDAMILAADTIVLAADAILGKPTDAADARAILHQLRNHPHKVYTAFRLLRVCVASPHTHIQVIDQLVGTEVIMRDYTDAEIDAYIATGDPFDKAGSYAIQHPQFRPVAQINGCYTNVVGLPVCAVKRALMQLEWQGILASDNCDCPPYASA